MPRSSISTAVKATLLLGRWTRLAQGHLPFGAGCSCGAGFVSVRVADYERDILDYLRAKHPVAAQVDSLGELLRTLALPSAPQQPELLTDLERSLASFERLHRS